METDTVSLVSIKNLVENVQSIRNTELSPFSQQSEYMNEENEKK